MQIQVYDIAGLVKGASEGKGLGNAFLGNIRAVDAIVHVVRCFNDSNVIHVNSEEGPRDPIKDVEVIELELILADIDSIDKRLTYKRLEASEKSFLNEAKIVLMKGDRPSSFAKELRHLNLLTMKPVLYALISDTVGGDDITRQVAAKLKGPSLAITAKLESELALEPDVELRQELLREFGFVDQSSSSLSRLSSAVAKLLSRRVFYTVGEQEARSWPLAPNDTAVDAASRIHTDIGKNFVNVEIQREVGGKPRVEGKDYKMQDGDIAYFRHRG
jgi:ribosome-binding ATPase YchF (GTP1/OBG family)